MIINILAALLTVMVLSRMFGDNPFFRTAQYIFVGVSLGLAFVVTYQEVLRPATVSLLTDESLNSVVLYLVPLVLGVLLLPRITSRQRWSWLANIPLALIFGVGAALAAGGAVTGTLLPQLGMGAVAANDIAAVIGVIVLALGTVAVLSSFYFTSGRNSRVATLSRSSATVGHWILMLAFGFFFAGAVQTYLAALIERLRFLVEWVTGLA